LSSQSVDVAIVGCGVSGASCALAAAAKGVSVAILEEHEEVGYPSHCSGHIGIQAFRKLGPQLPQRLIENEIKGAVLHAPSGESLTLHRSEPITWVINRAEFDKHLASLAAGNGATLSLNSRVDMVKQSANVIQLRIASQQKHEISCKIIVDASGCGTPVSRYMNLPHRNKDTFVNSAQVYVDNLIDVDSDFVELFFGQEYAPGFFGWIIPRRDGSAKVGLAADTRSNIQVCFDRFVKKHPLVSSKLRRARFLTRPRYHLIPVSGGRNRTYSSGFLVVGDAASQVKPTTGGGIVFGLACGQLAGQTAAEAVIKSDRSSSFLESYEVSWRKLIGFDLKLMGWLRRLMYRMPDQHLNRIFSISNELRTDEVLERTSDIDFQGRTLLSLSRDPRLFLTLLSASALSLPSLIVKRD